MNLPTIDFTAKDQRFKGQTTLIRSLGQSADVGKGLRETLASIAASCGMIYNYSRLLRKVHPEAINDPERSDADAQVIAAHLDYLADAGEAVLGAVTGSFALTQLDLSPGGRLVGESGDVVALHQAAMALAVEALEDALGDVRGLVAALSAGMQANLTRKGTTDVPADPDGAAASPYAA